ncbi:Ktr system potassium transporter KtrC [Salinicoccus jeotgali]|uniref:Ktr system potassium transporter KtrC n=1 Tax=Salinicoccus jeotgali TaxID=381634 RepID=A0ABP7ET23_9STAP
MNKSFAVFGLGHFGGTLVQEFHEQGIEVIAVDKDEDKVKEFSELATYAVCTRNMDESLLNDLGVRNVDHAFVSFGDDLEASILTSLLLKDIGVPKVWTKSQNSHHTKVLKRIGVDRVIQPSHDMAKKIARHINSDKMIDFIELSDKYSMAEIVATSKIDGETVSSLNLRAKYGCIIVGIHRDDGFNISPPIDAKIFEGDILIIIGRNDDIARFEKTGL